MAQSINLESTKIPMKKHSDYEYSVVHLSLSLSSETQKKPMRKKGHKRGTTRTLKALLGK